MKKIKKEDKPTSRKIEQLQKKVNKLESILNAIERGEIDSLLIRNKEGTKSIVTLETEDQPYRHLIESLSEGAITLSDEGELIHCNKKFSEMINIPTTRIIGSSMYDHIPNDQHQMLNDLLHKSNIQNEHEEFTLLVENSNDKIILLTRHNFSFGTVKGLSIIVTDISDWKLENIERIKAELELIRNEKLFRDFAENINDVFWRMTPAMDRITYVSPAYEIIWGLPCANLYLNPFEWTNSIHKEDKPKVKMVFEKLKLQESVSVYFKIDDADGVTKNIFSKGFQIKNKNGEILSFCGIASDITELTQMREHAHLADKLSTIGTLATGIVHEINNPLTWILANLEFIKKKAGTLEPEKLDKILNESIQGAKQISTIVTSLKGFSRVDTDETMDINLPEIFDSVLKISSSEIKNRAFVEKEFEKDLPPIKANTLRLQQVFLNLIINAAQAIPEGNVNSNKIHIVIKKERKNVRIDISDTGCGMESDVISKIFDPFYTTKPTSVGTGLGLSISYEIIKSFGGEITVESSPGKGSKFSVFLPHDL